MWAPTQSHRREPGRLMRSLAVVLAALAHLRPAQAHAHRHRPAAEPGETPPTPAWASWVGAEPLLGAADSEGADVHSGSPFAGSPAVAPELRPALGVATAVLWAVSQTPAAPGSDPNAARLRDAAAALLAEGALGRLLAEGAVARALRELLPVALGINLLLLLRELRAHPL